MARREPNDSEVWGPCYGSMWEGFDDFQHRAYRAGSTAWAIRLSIAKTQHFETVHPTPSTTLSPETLFHLCQAAGLRSWLKHLSMITPRGNPSPDEGFDRFNAPPCDRLYSGHIQGGLYISSYPTVTECGQHPGSRIARWSCCYFLWVFIKRCLSLLEVL